MRTAFLAVAIASLASFAPTRPQDGSDGPASITAIELSGSGAWPGQFWRIAFRSDYTSEWFHKIDPREGNYVGTISSQQWERLVSVVERLGISQLSESYAPRVEDDQRIALTMTRGSESKVVNSSNSAGPTELWALHMVMRGMAESVAWKRTYKGENK